MLFPWRTLRGLIWLLYLPWSFSLPWCSWAKLLLEFFSDLWPFQRFLLTADQLRFIPLERCVCVSVDSSSPHLVLPGWFLSVSSLLSFLLSSITLRFPHPWNLNKSAERSPARTLQAHADVHRSMVKSRISHSKSCSCGRGELLQKSLNNHVFPLIYSKYLRREQIKAGEERGQCRWSGWRMGGPQGTLLS